MRFPNSQFDCFIVLRILKTQSFYINYNKLVIWKFIDGNQLVLVINSEDESLEFLLCFAKSPEKLIMNIGCNGWTETFGDRSMSRCNQPALFIHHQL